MYFCGGYIVIERLIDIPSGVSVVFVCIEGGLGAEKRLMEMGLLPGEEIKVIHNSGVGPVTLSIKGVSLAIGHGLAKKIRVRRKYDGKSAGISSCLGWKPKFR